jgi:hypothetical protein
VERLRELGITLAVTSRMFVVVNIVPSSLILAILVMGAAFFITTDVKPSNITDLLHLKRSI